MTFEPINRDEHVVVYRGGSFPDICYLLTVGHVEATGRECFIFMIFYGFYLLRGRPALECSER